MNESKNISCDLVVIGGGASGLMLAATAAERGLTVTVLEIGRASCRERV